MSEAEKIPFELLETFVSIVSHDGSASDATEQLQISQPTMSKRLGNLRSRVPSPWLRLEGKQWKLTAEGHRVANVVRDLVNRYRHVEDFISEGGDQIGSVSFACGQTAIHGFAKQALETFAKDFPNVQLRVSTPRGKKRIEGVASGLYDLATVADSVEQIHRTADCELHTEKLFADQPVLIANPEASSPWGKTWEKLPRRRKILAGDIQDLPLILPESNSSRHSQFENWFRSENGHAPNVVLETGGWASVIQFAISGLGVGLATTSALETYASITTEKKVQSVVNQARRLDDDCFPPISVHLIYPKTHGSPFGGLMGPALNFRNAIAQACRLGKS